MTAAPSTATAHTTSPPRSPNPVRPLLPLIPPALLLVATLAGSLPAQSCPAELPSRFASIARASLGTMGIAAREIERGESADFNASLPLPMQSVFKLPIAIAILSEADHGQLDLAQPVVVTVADLAPGASAIAVTVAREGHHAYPIRELLDLMAGQSDNTAADILLGVAGGAPRIQQFLRDHGLDHIDVSLTEREMAAEYYGVPFPNGAPDPLDEFEAAVRRQSPPQRTAAAQTYSADPRNTATAAALEQLLVKLQTGALLSPASTTLLLGILTRSPILSGRLRGLLPRTVPVAHKSGSSATTNGVTAAANDVGVITLPDQSHLAIAVLIKDSSAPAAVRDSVIARVAKAAYDCWNARR
jgi:beta-lactamase class A